MSSKGKSTSRGKANGSGKTVNAVEGGALQTESSKAVDAKPEISPEMREKLSQLRERVQVSVGQAVLAMMNLPRYKGQSLADLNHLVIEPLLRDRLAIASAKKRGGEDGEIDASTTAGIAIWASGKKSGCSI